MNVMEIYGKDTVDLVIKIESFLRRKLKHQAFEGKYIQSADFCMTEIPDVGVFTVRFPGFPEYVIAGINMNSGDYYMETTKIGPMTLDVYELSGVNIKRLIDRAEFEWSMDAQQVVD